MNFKLHLSSIAALLLLAAPSFGQIVGMDDFDGGEMFTSRTFTPDNSANMLPGTFPGSPFDVFGIVDRNINIDFQDDTLNDPKNFGAPGMFGPDIVGNFMAHEDLDNGDNPDGTGTVEYEFDITGAEDLMLSIDIAAMGDFEVSNDINIITASIDGGTPETVMELIVDEDAVQTYTYDDGTMDELSDPMTVNGTFLFNEFQNFTAPIAGTGSTLTLTFSFSGNGGNELIAFDNLIVEGSGGKKSIPGDVNCDGTVNLLDVQPFVEAVSNSVYDLKADVNEDGADNLLDVAPFVELLTGG